MNPRIRLSDISDRIIIKGKASTLSEQLADIARTFGAQDMFSDCANYQPGISKQVMK
jgi:hypothetical protein